MELNYNTDQLRLLIIKSSEITQRKLAETLDITEDTMTTRLKMESDFRLSEAVKTVCYINKKLNKSYTVDELFLCHEVPKSGKNVS